MSKWQEQKKMRALDKEYNKQENFENTEEATIRREIKDKIFNLHVEYLSLTPNKKNNIEGLVSKFNSGILLESLFEKISDLETDRTASKSTFFKAVNDYLTELQIKTSSFSKSEKIINIEATIKNTALIAKQKEQPLIPLLPKSKL